MTVRIPDSTTNSTSGAPLSSGYRLAAFAIAAVVLVVVAIVTRSAEAVVTVASPLLLLLVWLSTGMASQSD
jgi:hypothetical protein